MSTQKIRVIKAKSFIQKFLGLIPYKNLDADKVMLFENCRAVHTFFMRFPIDLVFVDKDNRVVKLKAHLKTYRFCRAGMNAQDVYEASEGFIKRMNVQAGDDFSRIFDG